MQVHEEIPFQVLIDGAEYPELPHLYQIKMNGVSGEQTKPMP